jgi:hypothetical protein
LNGPRFLTGKEVVIMCLKRGYDEINAWISRCDKGIIEGKREKLQGE